MHSGPLVLLRMWLLHAPRWQQLLICLTFLLVGVALIAVFGQIAGALLIVFAVVSGLPALAGGRRNRSRP